MPGVYRAVSGDIDLDGDMDIAAVSLISRSESSNDQTTARDTERPRDIDFDGAIWLEQTAKGEFVRHRVLAGQCEWAACALMDLDQDEDLDLVLGRFIPNDESTEAIVCYKNRTND